MNWKAKITQQQGMPRIAVYFEKNATLIARVKSFTDARWDAKNRFWHVPDTHENRLLFDLPLSQQLLPNAEAQESLTLFKRYLLSKRYSPNTIATYSEALKSFLLYCGSKSIECISNADVIAYNNDYILQKNLSASYQNQVVNAIKLFFKIVKNSALEIDKIHRPKRAKNLPNVLSKEEVKAILMAHANLKHRTMLSVIYSCGLRCGELLSLQAHHIDSKRNIILIKNAKGKKTASCP